MTVITIVIGNDGRVQGTCDPPDAPLWPEDANATVAEQAHSILEQGLRRMDQENQ
jgi:hypothetical protein